MPTGHRKALYGQAFSAILRFIYDTVQRCISKCWRWRTTLCIGISN